MVTQASDDDSGVRARISRVFDASALIRGLRASREQFADSALVRAGKRGGQAARNSFIYRWLTKEPEPEVIVIDLRETWTVGPFIALLDRLVDWILPYWRGSAVKRGLDYLVELGERAAQTRAGQLLVRLLEPPEPPEERADPADDTDESDGDAKSER